MCIPYKNVEFWEQKKKKRYKNVEVQTYSKIIHYEILRHSSPQKF